VLKPAPKLTRELCHIDWNRPSRQIYNLIRGLSPYPAAFSELVPVSEQISCSSSQKIRENAHQSRISAPSEKTQLKIYFGEVVGEKYPEVMERVKAENPAPGTVLSDGKTYLAIATADGALALTDVQLSGKKRMDVKAFLLGWRNPESYKAI
jgi:methionyl-tRNA formyltransferase